MKFRNAEHKDHADRLTDLKDEVSEIKREIQSEETTLTLTKRVNTLKGQISQLEIDRDKTHENYDRREREVEHKVGLLLEQQDFEVEKAKQETTLEIREANLEAEQTRFEAEMKFMRERMEKEVDYVKEIAEKILDRLPDISASLRISNNERMEREDVDA